MLYMYISDSGAWFKQGELIERIETCLDGVSRYTNGVKTWYLIDSMEVELIGKI